MHSVATANDAAFAALVGDNAKATVTTLSNDYVELRLTDFGGAIRDVAFRKYFTAKGSAEPFVFNQTHAAPILAFSGYPGLDQNTHFDLVSATPRHGGLVQLRYRPTPSRNSHNPYW